jgi:hypothetical protein
VSGAGASLLDGSAARGSGGEVRVRDAALRRRHRLGPEHACRLIAEQVSGRHDIDVLTTCARDPRTWKNEYAEGADRMRGVLVRRFRSRSRTIAWGSSSSRPAASSSHTRVRRDGMGAPAWSLDPRLIDT